MSITNTFTATILELDANGSTLARRSSTATDAAATVGEFRSGNLIDTNEATLSFPIAQVRQFWLRNTDSAATITVKWTRNGGAEATVAILGPQDQIALWHNNTGASYGLSSVKLTASEANATYEFYLGG